MIEIKNLGKLFRIPLERRENTIIESIKRVVKPVRYKDVWALRNINFKVNGGEFIGIIGENGSGKTTLLKIIADVLSPTEGHVKTEGRIIPFLELGLGFHDDLTGRENIYLYSQILGLTKEEIGKRLDSIIKFSGLKEDFIDAKLSKYSSGMRLRLAFSTAIQTDPDILLVDEVLTVGDLEFQQKCFDVFRGFKRDKKTILYVSHDMNSIKKFCDKVILINKGKQIMFDKPERVIDEYVYNVIRKNKVEKASIVEFRGKDKKPDLKLIEDLKEMVNVRWGTKEIEITKVELFNKFNKKNTSFISGDPLKIRVHYKKNKAVQNPIFGIGIFREDGIHFFGTNTQVENYKINGLKKTGYIDCYIKRLGIQAGVFYLNVAVHDDNYYHYDWHNKRYMFRVIPSSIHDQGLLRLECKWKISD